MGKLPYIILILLIAIAFFLNLLALIHIFPMLLSGPILFISILIFIVYLNDRRRFRGF